APSSPWSSRSSPGSRPARTRPPAGSSRAGCTSWPRGTRCPPSPTASTGVRTCGGRWPTSTASTTRSVSGSAARSCCPPSRRSHPSGRGRRCPVPFGEEHSNQVIVAIDGTTLREDVAARLVSAYVDDSVHVPSMAVLRFSDERLDIVTDMGVKIGSALRVSVQQSGQGAPVEIFDGDVTALEQELDEDGAVATVRALDVRYRLHSGATTDAFTNLSVSDIGSKVVKDAGRTARVGSFGPQHDHLARDGESSWELLCRLARRVGAAVWVEGRTV